MVVACGGCGPAFCPTPLHLRSNGNIFSVGRVTTTQAGARTLFDDVDHSLNPGTVGRTHQNHPHTSPSPIKSSLAASSAS
ncbi:hypothetical protein CRUP_000927 [Coryphaenoides rupestris]|nr:hypothetical protein CRUP_000927 [Coryphaenoides rupestris]